MKLNNKPLLSNLESMTGVAPKVHVAEDLPFKKDYSVNSWFVIGHFDQGDEKLNFMYHLMYLGIGERPAFLMSILSITDENNKLYKSEEVQYPLDQVEMTEDRFIVKVSNGEMRGDLNEMFVKADFGWGAVDLKLHAVGFPIYNAGTGNFPLIGMDVYQYSIPNIESEGTLTFQGKTHEVNGRCWFDRQYEMAFGPMIGKWCWMDINLDNGEFVSLWGATNLLTEREHSWCTVLHPDGSQCVAEVEPLSIGEADIWNSEASDMSYPTRWTIKIPEFDACLEILPVLCEQEVISEDDPKYEAASTVKGTFHGEPVTGFCYVELVGGWRDI